MNLLRLCPSAKGWAIFISLCCIAAITQGMQLPQGGALLCRDGVYYLVGMTYEPGNNGKYNGFKGVDLFKTQDLATWSFVKRIIEPNLSTGSFFHKKAWIGRPAIVEKQNTFYLIYECNGGVAVSASEKIDGTYRFIGLLRFDPAIVAFPNDCSVFEDNDRVYLVGNCSKAHGPRKMFIYEIELGVEAKVGALQYVDAEGGAHEAPSIVRNDGKYFWFSSGLVGWWPSRTSFRVATSLAGPWSSWELVTSVGGEAVKPLGQHDFVSEVTIKGKSRWVLCEDDYSNIRTGSGGGIVFDELIWTNGEPSIGIAALNFNTVDDPPSAAVTRFEYAPR